MQKKDGLSKDMQQPITVKLIPILDTGNYKAQLNELIVDSMQDPLDRFNLNHHQTEIVDGLKHDWNSEYYLICPSKDVVAGYIKLSKYTVDRLVTVAFYLTKLWRGKGILKLCVPFIGERVFNQLGYNKIEASCTDLNETAKHLYTEIMNHEGTRRQHLYYAGKYIDIHLYGITKQESVFAEKG